MELEFDKEIDGLLRQAKPRDATAVPANVAAAAVDHLDADVIAAFTENALPAPARLLYTQHVADCTRCRQKLAFAIGLQLDQEAVADAAPASAPAPAEEIPWHRRLFSTPGLAVAFGALVLAFGFLGFLALRETGESNVAMVANSSAAAEPAPANVNSAMADLRENEAANASANVASNSAPALPSNTNGGAVAGRSAVSANANASGRPETFTVDGTDAAAMKANPPTAAAPPPPPPVSTADSVTSGATVTVTAEEDKKDKKKEARNDMAELQSQQNRNRESLLATPKQRSGPMRNSQTQSQVQNLPQVEPARRDASGRSFVKRDGAWYDTAYSGQQTIDVRRGSSEFRKLDAGLRNIANSIDGVVVALWKGKAYRIQ